jgi:alpha-methylacyl-CoA racemase
MRGPLEGFRILEVGGLGPVPFAGMVLADMGADVIRLDRSADSPHGAAGDPVMRGRQTIALDLKSPAGHDATLVLADRADALIEGFRPGVMERLGLGPGDLEARNPRLVYGRMTGFGQQGPMAQAAGHDINYISLAGVLGACRRSGDRPLFPLNLAGDYGGGAMFLAFGVVCGLLEAGKSGRGQVIDAAMVDGAALLTAVLYGLAADGVWHREAGTNLLDSGAHFYEVYETADSRHIAVGAIEPQFYARLLELLEIDAAEMPQMERSRWPEFKRRLSALFLSRDAAGWATLLEGEETCATVVHDPFDAFTHPHMAARGTFIELDGVRQPGPAPRFSRTPAQATPAQRDPDGALERWGVDLGAWDSSGSASNG